jgi:predicted AAA+ superfamily ATPase
LFGLTAQELAKDFNLPQLLNSGYLPRHYLSDEPHRLIASYVADYLKEEIAAEGLVRNLPSFSNFLDAAALSDTELTNFSTIARDCGVSSPSIKEYFQILEDTLLARRLPAYQKRPKRRVITSPKFYFSDLGVVNYLAKRKKVEIGSEVFGKAFENWLHHELQAFSVYSEQFYRLSYWRLASGVEVDFIVNDMEFAIEAKATKKVTSDHLRGLRSLIEDYPKVKRLLVCMESKARKTKDGILILPVSDFLEGLYAGLKWF